MEKFEETTSLTKMLKFTLFIILNIILTTNAEDKLPNGVVVTNGPKCAEIGTSILKKGGTAVDAAIAALLCEGVSIPNCMGIGGGFLMNIYIKKEKKAHFLVSREVAPQNSNETMFGTDQDLAQKGGLAVAVPGEVKGYWEAHQKYGKVEWKELIQPTIELCKEGIPVTKYLEKVLEDQKELILNDPAMKETFYIESENRTYKENEKIKRLQLAKTLELIAELGPDALYNGNLTEGFVKDIADKGGIITKEDLLDYKPRWESPLEFHLPSNQTYYAPPLPGSGVVLGLIMNVLGVFLDTSDELSVRSSIINWQRIIESFKFGYAKRTELGDPHFVNMTDFISEYMSDDFAASIREKISDNSTSQDPGDYGANVTQSPDHGTANVCVLAPNGDAVSVTSTINLDFGAGFMSPSTGIILNDQMDDFSSPGFTNSYGVPPSPNNYIEPGKRPVSSMSPSIVVGEDGNVRLVIGGSGGTRIITSVALAMIKNLWFNIPIKEAVAAKRIHHQLFPMQVQLEDGFDDGDLATALEKIGHNVTKVEPSKGFNTVTSISRENGVWQGTYDPRRGGAEGYVHVESNNGAFKPISVNVICYIFIFIVFKSV